MSQKESKLLDRYAHLYETIHDIDRWETSYRIRILLEHATGESVLEMGLGFGMLTSALSKRFSRVVGIDGSKSITHPLSYHRTSLHDGILLSGSENR